VNPHFLEVSAFTTKADVYSTGCFFWDLCHLKDNSYKSGKFHASRIIKKTGLPRIPGPYSDELEKVLKSMIKINPADRPEASELLLHKIFD
jgi:serine/threonine protein kinase